MADRWLLDGQISLTPDSDAWWDRDASIDVQVIESAGQRRAQLRVDRNGMTDGWSASPTVDDLDQLITLLQQARALLSDAA